MFHVGTKNKCEYTRCKKALFSGAHLSSVCPWSLAVPIAGELQAPGGTRIGAVHCDAPSSTSCSTGAMSSNTHLSAHMHFVPKGWHLAQTLWFLRTLSGHTVQEPYCVTVIRTTALLSLHCSSDRCRMYPDSGPLLLKDEVCRNHSISQCLQLSQSGDGAAWSSPFLKSGRVTLGVLEQCTNIIAWKPGICQGEECGRHGNSSPHLTAK